MERNPFWSSTSAASVHAQLGSAADLNLQPADESYKDNDGQISGYRSAIRYVEVYMHAGARYTITVAGEWYPTFSIFDSDGYLYRADVDETSIYRVADTTDFFPDVSGYYYIAVSWQFITGDGHYTLWIDEDLWGDDQNNALAGLPPPPTLISATPASTSSGVAASANIVLTFSEPMKRGTGVVEIYDVATGYAVKTISVFDSSQVVIAGSTVTINPFSDLPLDKQFYVVVGPGVFENMAGTGFAGLTHRSQLNFATGFALDSIPPVLLSRTPADNETGVSVSADLTLTFSEAVQAGTGAIEIRRMSDDGLAHSISITDTSQVSFSGATVTINPAGDLAGASSYYVNLAAGVVRDLGGNAYAGFSGLTAYNFTTDAVAQSGSPTLVSTSPADNAGNVPLGANLTLTFSEPVKAGTGAIEIRNTGGSLFQSIAITDASRVSISGATVTLNPSADLVMGGSYYVVMASGVILDLVDTPYAGLSSATAFDFTTLAASPSDAAAPVLQSRTPADDATGVNVNANLVLIFNEAILSGQGAIQIRQTTNGALFRSIAITDATQVTISGAQLTINPAVDLAANTGYYITIAHAAILDLSGNPYGGISTATAFNFTTSKATLGPDILAGGSGADTIDALAGDDSLQGLGGADQLTGGLGLDKALYAASSGNYDWWSMLDGSWRVKDLRAASPEGTDVLNGVESLQFSDRTVKIAGQTTAEKLTDAYSNILRATATGAELTFLSDLIGAVNGSTKTLSAAIGEIVGKADQTTAVAAMSYQFFVGFAPSKGGFDYLVSPQGPNPNNINSAYYQSFNIENRYINFAVNLGKNGEGAASFLVEYGGKTLFQATRDAYMEIFGGTVTDSKINTILDSPVGAMSRAQYFAIYGGNDIGTKAAMVGWLLTEAAKADLGMYARSSNAFFTDLADGAQTLIDLVGVYGRPDYAFNG